jgi:leucyl aminopeptidase
MRALAARKARANVVGLVGLVENMPSGTAQRPGDVVTSLAGKTIEVINTDAEGRSCWPTCSGTRRTGSSRARWSTSPP